ncbi:MAG: protein translocase subunit SecD [Alphaproteobacteria bacterium]|nr:protein translocase subunit SecD [Alphaproteobacteria bacterium]
MMYFARWKVALIAATCLLGIVFALPNLFSEKTLAGLPSWVPSHRLSLGLDLQGGSHLLLEVETEALVRERLENLVDAVRQSLRKDQIGYIGLGFTGRQVNLKLRDLAQSDKARESLRALAVPIAGVGAKLGGILGGGGPDIEVTSSPDGTFALKLTEAGVLESRRKAIQQSIEIVRRRIDETGVREPTIQQQGAERILVQLPGLDNPERIKQLLGKTAKMVFRLVDATATVEDAKAGRLPPGSDLVDSTELDGAGRPLQFVVRKQVMVSGENLVDAHATVDQRNNEAVVSFRFDSVGAKRFGEVTQQNVGRPFAIILDDKVISAPVIREAILGGSGQISGRFTVQTANDLALLLRAGALPAPLKIIEERTVGPELGSDSIRAGTIASIVAVAAVVIFMFLSYGPFAATANIALLANMVLLAAAMTLLQATLTLPGIAGIVLTVGMAVDANVLIFERIREELRSGKTPFNAVEAGYTRAFVTILDSNLTTIIAAILLYQFGSGPVRGFAVTLTIGIMASMFTAITMSRYLLVSWLRWARPAKIVI